ncbi:hypothetical protein PAPYR_13007 [Paratrimastix pyriformis]|uniref:Uncharacterized protein n=1 Tax=Paratrimastix pyriformis TaxID=342808 RepID=A0ABQ8U4N4_9EUKA|nr:hypothetical protein PAPYR_13007 [Paratrimastix pyriformis]
MLPTSAEFEPSTGLYWHRFSLFVRNHTHDLLRALRDGSEARGTFALARSPHLAAAGPCGMPLRAPGRSGVVQVPAGLLPHVPGPDDQGSEGGGRGAGGWSLFARDAH